MSQLLDRDDRVRAASIRTTARRSQFETGRILVKLTLGELTGTDASEWRVVPTPSGRPQAIGRFAVDVSLSHDVTLVAAVAGVDEGRLGIDTEDLSRRVPFERLARRYFSPHESGVIDSLDDPDRRRERFWSLWTLKEAHAKATGQPLAEVASQIGFSLSDDTAPGDRINCTTPGWSHSIQHVDGHVVAVAASAGGPIPAVAMIGDRPHPR